jgi:hypothetical protein
MQMRLFMITLLLAAAAIAQSPSQEIPVDDAIRIKEFYRLAAQIQDNVWPNWSQVPTPLLIVTPEEEFLTHNSAAPKDFKPAGNGFYARPRQFPTNLQATFPAFGPPSVIVIGQPKNTNSKTSTPWLITLMHEHFHQLQNAQPRYFQAMQDLGLSRGDTTGMWILNYPFPYENPEVARSFADLRDVLLSAVNESDKGNAEKLAQQYVQARKKFFAQLSPDDSKYFNFQLWQEGIARYTQIKSAEAAAQYKPTAEYTALADFESFSAYAAKARSETLNELKRANLGEWKRTVVYSFGAAEGLLLDRLNPKWKEEYFKRLLSMDSFFRD